MRTSEPLVGAATAPDLHIMSFNIRRDVHHLNPWSQDAWSRRVPLVRQLLANEKPTLLGMQELMPHQLITVQSALGEHYERLGQGRNANGGGEQCPIFYDSRRLTMLKCQQLALSDTPEVPGSMSWGNWVPRIAVKAVFRDESTGHEFLLINTHLDHFSRKSRLKSTQSIHRLVTESAMSAIVTGDFNAGASTEPYRALERDGLLRDSWTAAREQLTEPWGTFPHYRSPRRGQKRIDWIFATKDVAVDQAGINVTRFDGAWPSDHAPVHAVVRVKRPFESV